MMQRMGIQLVYHQMHKMYSKASQVSLYLQVGIILFLLILINMEYMEFSVSYNECTSFYSSNL